MYHITILPLTPHESQQGYTRRLKIERVTDPNVPKSCLLSLGEVRNVIEAWGGSTKNLLTLIDVKASKLIKKKGIRFG